MFGQDGSLALEVALTGIILTRTLMPQEASAGQQGYFAYGRPISRDLIGINHQHIFTFRLDFDVDGRENSVVELNTVTAPVAAQNAYKNAFVTQETVLRNEAEARRCVHPQTSRRWMIVNPTVKNALGQPVAYMLLPGENSPPYAASDSSVRIRTPFINHHLRVTPYNREQIFADGYYVNRIEAAGGLASEPESDRSIERKDVVLWYTMIISHTPRPEDWPVMSVVRAGFRMEPCGFFSRSPALDVPTSP